MSFTLKQKKLIFDKISTLSATEHEEIFNIIQRLSEDNPINYTSNKNGVFFNLSTLSDDVLKAIDSFVNFCHENKKTLDEYEKQLNECKASTNNIINVNLENIVEKRYSTSGNEKQISALPICDWNNTNIEATLDTKTTQKIVQFIEKLYTDKACKKKMNIKFHNAKKKYGKKVITDSKFEYDVLGDLQSEQYIFI